MDTKPYYHADLWDMSEQSGMKALYFFGSKEAGGEIPEAVWGYDPSYGVNVQLGGTYRLAFKKIKTQAAANNYVSVKYAYKADKNSTAGSRVFGLAARKGDGEWQICKYINKMTTELGRGLLVGMLPDDMRNAADVQISVFFTTQKDNVQYMLYMDDIEFFAYPENDYAVDFRWADDPFTANGRDAVGLSIENAGNGMESCEISYTLDDGEVKTMSLTFSDGLMPGEIYTKSDFVPENWGAAAYGSHTLTFWLSKANGVAIAAANIKKQVRYLAKINPAIQPYQYRPVVEHFSASSCPPCASMNAVMNPVYEELGDTISMIKYQMDFPNAGDPYYTEEGGERRDYYGVSAVPTIELDGMELSTRGETVESLKNKMLAATNKKVYYRMWFDTVAIDANQNIRVTLKVRAEGGADNVVLHTVVEEGTTYGNVGSNGETEFHNVMMKMLPDAKGIALERLKPDTVYTFTYAYDMRQTHMEEFTDLRVACFLQAESGKILQSVISPVGCYGEGDGAMVQVDYVPSYICAENVPAGLQLICTGNKPLTSVEVEAKVGAAGTPMVQTYPVSMKWGESTYVTFDGLKATATGTDTVSFKISKVNGTAFDGQAFRQPIRVQPTQSAFLPSLEVFTSATSAGSATLNQYVDALGDDICNVKYPMKGDKYMRTVYTRYADKMGIEAAPALVLNGHVVGVTPNGKLTHGDYFENLLAQVQQTNGIFEISVEDGVAVRGSDRTPSVVANFNFESPVDISGRLYALVVETVTEKNAGSNGEKQIKRVVQSLFPDENGASMRIRNGKGFYVLSRAIMSPTIEDYGNLRLVLIVKDAAGKEVLQTAEFPILNQLPNESVATYETLSVYPNPASEYVYLEGLEDATVDVFDMAGAKVFSLNGVDGNYTLDVRNYVPGAYIIKVREGVKVSTARISVVR